MRLCVPLRVHDLPLPHVLILRLVMNKTTWIISLISIKAGAPPSLMANTNTRTPTWLPPLVQLLLPYIVY
jgi:hypothetical protein